MSPRLARVSWCVERKSQKVARRSFCLERMTICNKTMTFLLAAKAFCFNTCVPCYPGATWAAVLLAPAVGGEYRVLYRPFFHDVHSRWLAPALLLDAFQTTLESTAHNKEGHGQRIGQVMLGECQRDRHQACHQTGVYSGKVLLEIAENFLRFLVKLRTAKNETQPHPAAE